MADHNPARIAVMGLSLLLFIVTVAFNALAGIGIENGLFLESTGNISDMYDTDITPAGWTFSIWGVIYPWLSCMLIYVFSGLCRRNAYGWMYCAPAVLPYGFFVTWIINMSLNMSWLFLFDRELMAPAVIVSALMAFTNYLIIFFSCHGLKVYGPWLNKYHKVDLWLIRILVQNGVAVYATWTTIATLLNLTIVLAYKSAVSMSDASTLSLSLLLIEVLGWFVLENFILDSHVRYILTVYPVVILALSGNMSKNFKAASPSNNGIFTAVLLSVACTLFTVRLALVVWRHRKKPYYQDRNTAVMMSPMDMAGKQKIIFI
ncbi:hypothetical protein AAFF_G00006600 [Aldrovandia affinis]|uniref:Uncharacterized protein n=1 Tax=Aldrovandia affinis TaxID=143900 RepID=A0AAD7TDY7_9TELE|nr:hypothetical protein AAFF_G00006600 [Aldrovandia affinis]